MFYMHYKWGVAQQHVLTMRHCAAMLNETDCGSCNGAHGVKRWKNRKRCIITVIRFAHNWFRKKSRGNGTKEGSGEVPTDAYNSSKLQAVTVKTIILGISTFVMRARFANDSAKYWPYAKRCSSAVKSSLFCDELTCICLDWKITNGFPSNRP